MTVVELLRWLTEHTLSWSLEVNPERLVYADRRTYLTEHLAYDEMDPDVVTRLCGERDLFELRAYPSNAVGFVMVHNSALDPALRDMAVMLGADHT